MSVLLVKGSNYFSKSNVAIAKNSSSVTLMSWVKPSTYPTSGSSDERYSVVELSTGTSTSADRLSITLENVSGAANYKFGVFSRRLDADSAFPARWTKRVSITNDGSLISQTSPNVTWKIVTGSLPADVFLHAKSDGSDIRFSTDISGTNQIPVDIASFYTSPFNHAEIYINVPDVSASVNKTIYMWYGNPTATLPAYDSAYGRNAVWTSIAARAVYHFEESSGTVINSQGVSARNGTATNVSQGEDVGDGTNEKCAHFIMSANGRIVIGQNIIPSYFDTSVECWIWLNSYGSNDRGRIISEENVSAQGHCLTVNNAESNDAVRWRFSDTDAFDSGDDSISIGAWYHVVVTYENDPDPVAKLYVNGQLKSTTSAIIQSGGANTTIGAKASGVTDRNFDGWIDELRVYDAIQSLQSVQTSYESQADPTAFILSAGTPVTLADQDRWDTNTGYSTGQWYHVAANCRFDTGTIDLYINGAYQETSPTRFWASGATSNTDVLLMTIGKYFSGQVEDVRIYEGNLTADIIKTIYNAQGSDGIINGLVARYPLNELKHGYVTSATERAVDLTVNNFALSASAGITYQQSELGLNRRKRAP